MEWIRKLLKQKKDYKIKKMDEISLCEVVNCFNNKRNGDLFFCPPCRSRWRAWLKKKKLHDEKLEYSKETLLLHKFLRKGVGL